MERPKFNEWTKNTIMEDYIIIIPTHKRHDYLLGKIRYYSDTPYQVFICDSTPEEYRDVSVFPSNIHYYWCPDKSFLQKVIHVLNYTEARFYNLTPDDDFLDLDTVKECCERMNTDESISLSVGKQVYFNKPYNKVFFSTESANRLKGANLFGDKVKNASYFGSHYQNLLWSVFRKDTLLSSFNKLESVKPENANYIELIMATEACVRGNIYVSCNPLNYRELSKDDHWGKQVEDITIEAMESNPRMKSDMEMFLNTYQDDDKAVAVAFMNNYLKIEKRWALQHIYKAIKRRLTNKKDYQLEKVYDRVDRILRY